MVGISSRREVRFLMWLRETSTRSAGIDRAPSSTPTAFQSVVVTFTKTLALLFSSVRQRRRRAAYPRHFALIGDNDAWSKQSIRSRARWCHTLPALHYGGYIYDIMMCCANKTFGCHGHAHLLDSALGEALSSRLLLAASPKSPPASGPPGHPQGELCSSLIN